MDAVIKQAARFTIVNIETKEPSLEDLFLDVLRSTTARRRRRDAPGNEGQGAMRERPARESRARSAARHVGWGIGVAAVVLMYAAFYPSIKESAADLQAYMDNLPEAIRAIVAGEDYTSPVGYLESEFFNTMGALVVLIFAIGAGARSIAGEEEAGTLDLLLSTPCAAGRCSRRRRSRSSATAVAHRRRDRGLDHRSSVRSSTSRCRLGDVAAACVMLALLGLSFGGIAFAVGAATGRRTLANCGRRRPRRGHVHRARDRTDGGVAATAPPALPVPLVPGPRPARRAGCSCGTCWCWRASPSSPTSSRTSRSSDATWPADPASLAERRVPGRR